MMLLHYSPLINGGDINAVNSQIDQRGGYYHSIDGITVDIGAIESQFGTYLLFGRIYDSNKKYSYGINSPLNTILLQDQ